MRVGLPPFLEGDATMFPPHTVQVNCFMQVDFWLNRCSPPCGYVSIQARNPQSRSFLPWCFTCRFLRSHFGTQIHFACHSDRAVAGKLGRFCEKHFKNSRKFVPGRDMWCVHLNDSGTTSWKVSRWNRPSFPATALPCQRAESGWSLSDHFWGR